MSGVREKILAAQRAGMKVVVYPNKMKWMWSVPILRPERYGDCPGG